MLGRDLQHIVVALQRLGEAVEPIEQRGPAPPTLRILWIQRQGAIEACQGTLALAEAFMDLTELPMRTLVVRGDRQYLLQQDLAFAEVILLKARRGEAMKRGDSSRLSRTS